MKSNGKTIIGVTLVILIIGGVWLWIKSSKTSESVSEPTNNPTPTMPPPTSESPTFINTIWTAKTIAAKPPETGTTVTVQFDNQGKVNGSDGCNTFSTGYTADGANLTIDQAMASTNKACDEIIMQQADSFTKALLTTTKYNLGDGMMVLYQGEVGGLSFIGQSNSLSKTSWNVTGYNNGKQAVISPILGTTLSITFGDDGTVSGNSGCNTYSGQYNLKGPSISIGPLASTMKACDKPQGIMEQETTYLTALQKANSWQIQGNQLSLRTTDDQLAVVAISNLVAPTP